METKKCIKCGQIRFVDQFNFKNKFKNRRNARCKDCTRKDVMASYYKNKKYYLDYRARRNKEIYQRNTLYIYEYLRSHPCVDCGNRDPRVLQFDHVRGEKKIPVGNLARFYYSLDAIMNEIKKCEIRCANCHAVKTAIERQYYYSIPANKSVAK